MGNSTRQTLGKAARLGLAVLGGLCLLGVALFVLSCNSLVARADPIDPPEGYPKLSLSTKAVTPTLASTGGVTLTYVIEIVNTGAYAAAGTMLTDVIPAETTYNDDLQASVPSTHTFAGGVLSWHGDVGFDATVVVSFSVAVDPAFGGVVRNAAVISHPLIASPVTATAETVVTDGPILTIEKTSSPEKPGANKPLVYTIVVGNQGQPASATPITVTDVVPLNTTVLAVGADGVTGTVGSDVVVTWTRSVTLDLGGTAAFTFSVEVGDVSSGTVIANEDFQVASPLGVVAAVEPYTVTVIDPIFRFSKYVWPDPPGSNREMTYTLTLLNVGSLATDVVITDRLPAGAGSYFRYVRGGVEDSGVVSWSLSGDLDTYESAQVTYTIYISDVMGVDIVNDEYVVCSAEEVCQPGEVLTNVVKGPTFKVFARVDPIARKPGGGALTITLGVRNLGPGNALDARAVLVYRKISIQEGYLIHPGVGTPFSEIKDDPGCTSHCSAFEWWGSIGVGEVITFATTDEPSTQVGEEGSTYTATIVITDGLSNMQTTPVSDTATGRITHMANLIPSKSGPRITGRGQVMTYTIRVRNTALATDEPPYPYLWDVLPISGVTVLSDTISHGGKIQTVTLGLPGGGTMYAEVISWTLPGFGTGESLDEPCHFAVRVDDDLVSGTQVFNRTTIAGWWETEDGVFFQNPGKPVTTTVVEVGLVDSYKEVTPTVALPGPDNLLTYYLHIVNSSPLSLTGITVDDTLPWQSSTYQRDAVASAGTVTSDVVSIRWEGDVAGLSSEVVTFTVLVDADYRGPVTNTAVISHPDLLDEVVVDAVAYITDEPVLQISKSASPDPVPQNGVLHYRISVVNLGQLATGLVITDAIPDNTTYVVGSATAGGEYNPASDQVRWTVEFLASGGRRTLEFDVTVANVDVVNERYVATCAEGVVAVGEPVETPIQAGAGGKIYLPLLLRNS
jgi:uncharacterized repeat protein (TIGR01451 family)